MSNPALHWRLISQQGQERNQNLDAFALFQTDHAIWVIAVDVSTTSACGSELSHYIFIQFEKLLQEQEPIDAASVPECVERIHQSCKKELRVGKASLNIIWKQHHANTIYSFGCGDCRAGILAHEEIDWQGKIMNVF